MSNSYRTEGHNRSKGELFHMEAGSPPQRHPHRAGPHGDTCKDFPCSLYSSEFARCGVDNLEVPGDYGFMHVRCPLASRTPSKSFGRHSFHVDSLVVAVDGACPDNGSHLGTKSACGVYFGPDSPENVAVRIQEIPGTLHTNQRAELIAAIAGIEASVEFIFHGGQWQCSCDTQAKVEHLVIKSDSAYLVNGITRHIKTWHRNGWRTAKGTQVKNIDLWERLDTLTQDLFHDTGVVIDFWHVPRDQNRNADRLANLGLESSCRNFFRIYAPGDYVFRTFQTDCARAGTQDTHESIQRGLSGYYG